MSGDPTSPSSGPSGDQTSGPSGSGGAALAEDAIAIRIARQFIEAVPHSRILGMQIEHLGKGSCTASMPWDARLIGDPATGVIHGGAVSALLDTASGAAVLSHPEAGAAATATLDLRIDYMRPATPGQTIFAEAECYHVTRSVAFVRAHAYDDDRARPVAAATGAFTLERGRRG